MRRNQSPCKIIVIWAVNNLTAYKILTAYVKIFFNNYRHQTTNYFEKLLTKEDHENTPLITAPILINIHIHIRPTGFLEDGILKVVYSIDGRIEEGLVIIFRKD